FNNSASSGQILTIGTSGSAGTLTAGGAADTDGEITLYNSTFTGTKNGLSVNSVIADNGLGKVSVNAYGYLQLNVANTYSGGTVISRGRVQTGTTNSLGSGPVYVYPGGQAFLNASGFFTNDFYILGYGTIER